MIGASDQILEFVNGLWLRRWRAVTISWVVCMIGWVAVATLPDEYEVSTTIYVDTTSLLQPLLQGIAVEPDIASEVRLIRQTLLSRRNIEQVIRLTDLDLSTKTKADAERLIQLLDRKTRLTSVARQDNLFSIEFTDADPERARNIVEAFTTVLVETNLGEGRNDADNAQQFIDEQIVIYRDQLEASENTLADFEQKHGRFLAESSGNVLSDFLAAQSGLRDAEARRDELKRQLSQISRYIEVADGNAGFGAGPPSDVEVQIAELEGALENLLAQYTENHPDVIVVRRRLAAMTERLEARQANLANLQGDGASPEISTYRESNPIYGELKVELVKTESEIGALTQKHERLQKDWLEIKERAEQAPLLAAEKKKLARNYDVINEKYQQLLSRSEASKIGIERTVKADNVKFRIIDPPIIPTEPVGPNRELFLTIVLVFGLGVGVTVASLLVLARETVQGTRALRASFSIPVYGAIQDISASSRHRRYMDAFAIITAVGCLLAVFLLLLFIETKYGLQSFETLRGPFGTLSELREILKEVLVGLKNKV